MLILVEISHQDDQVILREVQEQLDVEMTKMGLTKLKTLDNLKLRSVYYELHDKRMGIRPLWLGEIIKGMNRLPSQYRMECKLVAESTMP